MRSDVAFTTGDGVTLRGWHYPAKGVSDLAPVVVMAHGFSAVKEMGLDDTAAVLSDAGIGCLVYDHRGFGASDGPVRQEADPWAQLRDYRDAITFAETLAGVAPARIGVWGTSYSGAHVLVVAALDRRVKAVVSQAPLISGLPRLKETPPEQFAAEDADRRGRARGEPPAMVPATSPPDGVSVLAESGAWDWFSRMGAGRAPAWRNEVTLRSVDYLRAYDPGAYVPYIAPTPLMMIVALQDVVTPAAPAIEAFGRVEGGPKELVQLPGGHFDVYEADFERASSAAREWFAAYL